MCIKLLKEILKSYLPLASDGPYTFALIMSKSKYNRQKEKYVLKQICAFKNQELPFKMLKIHMFYPDQFVIKNINLINTISFVSLSYLIFGYCQDFFSVQ